MKPRIPLSPRRERVGVRGLLLLLLLANCSRCAKSTASVDGVEPFLVPLAMLTLLFLVIMSSTPQLLNGVLEEKMSRISEVLLGSVTPFQLMMGKLIGNAAQAYMF